MESDIRILIAVGSLEIGGSERQIAEICRRLEEREFRIDVMTLSEGGPLAAALTGAAARVHSLGLNGTGSSRGHRFLRLVQAIPRCRSRLRQLEPDLIHAYLPEMSVVAAASRWPRRNPPLIVSKRNLVRWVARDPIYFPIARWINRRADVVLANSRAVRQEVIAKEGARADRLRVIYNGVDAERFRPGPADEALAREFLLPAGVPVIGMVANLHGYKGHADVVEAAAILRGRGQRVMLLFVGRDGDASEDLRRKVRDAGLGDCVRFVGPRRDVPDLLPLFDVFVSASREEGFSNAILEAMAAARAIVGTSVGGTLEQIRDGENGLLVEPEDPANLASALTRMLREPELRLRLGASARQTAIRSFSLEKAADQMASLYREVIRKSRERRGGTPT
jgi:glycosyltransferase involved in cell wall biosynthesis